MQTMLRCVAVVVFLSGATVAEARDIISIVRAYVGQNPTGLARDWCADFVNFGLEKAGYKRYNSRRSLDFLKYGRRLKGPKVGALAIQYRYEGGRRVGGHIGVVSELLPRNRMKVVAGNTSGPQGRRVVSEDEYPRAAFFAFVMP